jgi:hypothetical protein
VGQIHSSVCKPHNVLQQRQYHAPGEEMDITFLIQDPVQSSLLLVVCFDQLRKSVGKLYLQPPTYFYTC